MRLILFNPTQYKVLQSLQRLFYPFAISSNFLQQRKPSNLPLLFCPPRVPKRLIHPFWRGPNSKTDSHHSFDKWREARDGWRWVHMLVPSTEMFWLRPVCVCECWHTQAWEDHETSFTESYRGFQVPWLVVMIWGLVGQALWFCKTTTSTRAESMTGSNKFLIGLVHTPNTWLPCETSQQL